MIAGEMLCVELLTAVLAGMVVSEKNVPARELYVGVITPDKREETDNGRLPYRNGNPSDLPLIFLKDLYLSEIDKGDGFFP